MQRGEEGAPGGTASALADALAQSELLRGATKIEFEHIQDQIHAVHLEAGDELIAKGDDAEHLFVVVDGQLEVVLDTGNGTQQLSLLRPGAVVGEIGLLAGDTRSATVRAVSACDLVAVSAEGVRRLLAENPAHAEELARRASQRLRRGQLIEHFTRLVGVIDPDLLATIEEFMEWVSVPAGTQLFAEGDVGDAAYLVATGRLRAFRRNNQTGADVEIGEIGRAELVGEMALLDGGPRSASVYSVRDSQLIRFSRAAYDELLHRYPHIGLQIAQMALRRTRSTAPATRGRERRLSFALVAATPGVDVIAFAEHLAGALGPTARVVTGGDIDTDLGRDGMADIADDDLGYLRLAYRLEELEQRHRYLVYVVDPTWTPWSQRALRWSDHVLLVADAGADPTPGPLERELWATVTRRHHPAVSLALVHPADTRLPTGTRAWLEHRSVASHHHVRRGRPDHMARLARLLAGTATSLVLGGGGARGFAHLGVLQVLEDEGVPIDMVGGTSIGAIMAAGPAMGWSAAEMRRAAIDSFTNLFDYTLPTTSLLRGRRITSKLERHFHGVDITDLWLPYFCVSTNLTRGAAEVHDRGPLVRSIRASIAIPGVLPPVPHDGDLLVDGGVLDNVPVDEMRRRNPTGKVVAVDVAPVEGPVAERDYGLSASGLRAMLMRRRGVGPPNLISTMVRASIIGSVRDRHRVVEDEVADLYLDVAVDGGGMLDFSAGEQIADGAATATRPILTSWFRDAGNGQNGHNVGYVRTAPARRAIVDPASSRRRLRRGGVLLLTLRDLQFRAARFGAVVLGTSVVLTLLFLMTGLTEQFHREPRDTVSSFGADGWVLREGASGAFTSAATMPAEVAGLVVGASAAPVVVARHSLTEAGGQTDIVVVGFAPGRLGEPVLESGRLPRAPDEVVIDDASGLDIGETARVGDRRYVVTGTTDRRTMFAGMPLVFMELRSAQQLLYRGADLATAVVVDGTPTSLPEGFTIVEPAAVAEDALRPLERSISSVNLIRILLWLVAALIIGTMTYLSALERRRDVAVLKAVGAATTQLGASIALQGALIALVAACLASVLQVVMVPVFPLEVTVPGRAFVQVPLIAVLVALAAGAVGLRNAVRTDPALAFAGPGS